MRIRNHWTTHLLAIAKSPGLLPGERRRRDEDLEQYVGDSTEYNCVPSPPCGGCNRCIEMQVCYYADMEAEHRYRRAKLGLLVAAKPIPWLGFSPHQATWYKIFEKKS